MGVAPNGRITNDLNVSMGLRAMGDRPLHRHRIVQIDVFVHRHHELPDAIPVLENLLHSFHGLGVFFLFHPQYDVGSQINEGLHERYFQNRLAAVS